MLVMLKNRGQKDSILTSESSTLNSEDSKRVVLLKTYIVKRVEIIKKLTHKDSKTQVTH